jgi:hypothetical protein
MVDSTGVARSHARQERRYRRFKLKFPVHLLVQYDQGIVELDAISRDVSIGGLLLDCPLLIPPHSPVNFVINLRSRSLRALELLGDGTVVRVETRTFDGNVAVAVECNSPIAQIESYLADDLS